MSTSKLDSSILDFDCDGEISRISEFLKNTLISRLRKRGLVVAMSGGIDSSVSAALAVRALGNKRVFALLLPEKDSSGSSSDRGEILAKHLGIEYRVKNIASTLDAIGCYEERDAAIKAVFPEYTGEWKNKIVISGGLEGHYNHFNLVVETPEGETITKRLGIKEYLTIVAATNYKQRIRKTVEYFHADRLNYAVVGTPNRLEYDQGFFVKNGDGSADIKPIAHLYKSQVYQLARHMGLPKVICDAIPTTDTYSLPQGQDEFYFALPYQQMDVAVWAYNHKISPVDLAAYLDVNNSQAEAIYKDIEAKRRTTEYLHLPGQMIEKIDLPFE